MTQLQALWRVALPVVLLQFIARKGSGGVFAADFLSKKSGEQFPGAAACDKKLLALLFPEAYEDGGSDSAAGQDNAAQIQTAAAFGNFYISIPFDNPQLKTALKCYEKFPAYMMPNVHGDSSVMPKNRDHFFSMVDNALQQEIEIEPDEASASGGDAPLATPAATTRVDTALVTRATVYKAIYRAKAKAEEQGAVWQAGWTPGNWDPKKFHFVSVTEMLAGLEKNVKKAVDWATGAVGGDEGSRTPAVVNVVYQIMVEPVGLDAGEGPNKVRSDGCESDALEDLQKRARGKDIKEETLCHAQQIICKSDLWTLVNLWNKNPNLFLDDGHGVDVGGLQEQAAGPRGETSKARTTWRLEFVLPTWLSHEKSEDVVGNNMKVITFTAPRESFRSDEELKSVQRALTFMPQLSDKSKFALKAKEGGQFSNTPEPESKRTRPEQTLLLRTKEFSGSGAEAANWFKLALFTCPRWDRHPDDLPPKAALVIGSPVMDKAAKRLRGFENGEEARALQEWKSSKSLAPPSSCLEGCLPSFASAWAKCPPFGGPRRSTESETRRVATQKDGPLPLYYGEHMTFYDSLNNESIENIVPEWRLFGNWLNDGKSSSSKLFHRGITKLLSRVKGVKDHQGIPYKQSHNLDLLALAAPTKKQSSSFCLARMCKLMEKLTLTLQDRHKRESGAGRAS